MYAHRRELAATANALTLAKCLRQKMWPDSRQQCRQLPSVNRSVAKAFADKGVSFHKAAISESCYPCVALEKLTWRTYRQG